MYRNLSKKIFHVIMIIVIIVAILCVAGIFILRYQVEGESNMPFKITKINIVESVEGIDNQEAQEKWNFKVNHNNDIYVYVVKNNDYGKTEFIEKIEVKNININKQEELGELKLYKPVLDEKKMFINATENEITEITYERELEADKIPYIKELKISNQGGKLGFRYAINNISQYVSEQDEQIDHSQLLKLTGIKPENLKTNLSFDIIINLISGKKYQATVNLDIPSDEIIEKSPVGIEIRDLEDIIFKRIEN